MDNTKNAYLALGYACNQKCRCCPLVNKNDRELIAPLERVLSDINKMVKLGVTDVTVSGGEPTLHPNFFSIIETFFRHNIAVHILSNGEKFYDKNFSDLFITLAQKGDVSVTTTFHSTNPIEHEYQNLSVGSFERSLKGIQYLDANGINISIKHCITSNNYKDLPEFIRFALSNFSDNAEIQLWGIDLCGINEELARESFIDFIKIKPYVERAIDYYENYESAKKHVLTINNLPLCMCNCYYWKYYTVPESDNYIDHTQDGKEVDSNSGPISVNCKGCQFRKHCMGAYYSDFEILGDDIVNAPELETKINNYKSKYIGYNESNLDKSYFSPYLTHQLLPEGYYIYNNFTKMGELLRLKTEQILLLQQWLSNGINGEVLTERLNEFGVDGTSMANDFILKGIIE